MSDKLVRYLINSGLVRVDDIPDEQVVDEAILVMEGMQHRINELENAIVKIVDEAMNIAVMVEPRQIEMPMAESED